MADDNTGGTPFSREQLNNSLRVRDAARDIANSMKDAFKGDPEFREFTTQTTRDLRAVATSADKFAQAQERARKSSKSINNLIGEASKLRAKSAKFSAEIRNNELEQERNLQKINKLRSKANKAERELTGHEKERIRLAEESNRKLETQNRFLADSRDNSDQLVGDYESLAKASNAMGKSIYSAAAGMSEFLGLSQHLTDGFKEANESYRARKIALAEQENLQRNLNKLVDAENEKRAAAGEKLITLDDVLKQGTGLSKENIIKFDLVDATGGKTSTGGGKAIMDRQKEMREAAPSPLEPIVKMGKGLMQVAKQFLKVMVAAKAVAAIAEMIQYALFGTDKEITNIAKEFSITKDAAAVMRRDIADMAATSTIFGANTENLVKLQMAFTKETGMAIRLNQDQLETMSLMTRQMGISEGSAIKLTEIFKAQGVESGAGLKNLYNQHQALVESGNTAMSFKQLTEDIAGDTELMYIAQTKGAEAAMKNAAAVRRTGLSLAQQRSMAEGTLDFEKTMTNQLELQLLTGKNINMQRAMQLSLQGKNGEAVAEMQKQMKGLTAEQRKNPLIMNKMLEILGMSREEYYAMIKAQQQQAAAEASIKKAKEEFKKDEINGLAYYNKMLTEGYDETLKNEYAISEERGKAMEAELLALENKMAKENEANFAELSAEEKKAAVLAKYHATALHNAKVRAGVSTAEYQQLQANVDASEAFSLAMAEVKQLFADLVGTGAIQDLTNMIVDFVTRAKQVGFGRAFLGGGTGREDIEDEYGTGTFDSVKNLSSKTATEKEKAQAAADAAELIKKAGVGKTGTDEGAIGVALSGVKSAKDFQSIVDSYAELNTGKTLAEDLKSEMSTMELQELMQQINQQAIAAGNKAIYDIQKISQERDEAKRTGRSGQFNKDFTFDKYTTTEDFIIRPGQPVQKFRKDDLLIGGTNLGGGNSGKVEQLLERLVSAVENGGDVIMDGNKVGTVIAMNSSKFS